VGSTPTRAIYYIAAMRLVVKGLRMGLDFLEAQVATLSAVLQAGKALESALFDFQYATLQLPPDARDKIVEEVWSLVEETFFKLRPEHSESRTPAVREAILHLLRENHNGLTVDEIFTRIGPIIASSAPLNKRKPLIQSTLHQLKQAKKISRTGTGVWQFEDAGTSDDDNFGKRQWKPPSQIDDFGDEPQTDIPF
jgi:hypothetical protein